MNSELKKAVLEKIEKANFHDLCRIHGNLAAKAGYENEKSLQHLIREILNQNLVLSSINSREVRKILTHAIEERKAFLAEDDPQLRAKFDFLQETIAQFEKELEDLDLKTLEQRRYNYAKAAQWWGIFGDFMLENITQEEKLRIVKTKLQIVKALPAISRVELEGKLKEDEERALQIILDFRILIARGDIYVRESSEHDFPPEKIQAMKEREKLLFRELRWGCHEDFIPQKISKSGRKRLKEIFNTLTAVKRYRRNHYQVNNVAELFDLEEMYGEMKTILQMGELELDGRRLITGDTLNQKIESAKKHIKRLKVAIEAAKVYLIGLMDDPRIREYILHLCFSPSEQKKAKQAIVELTEKYREEAEKLEAELEEHFRKAKGVGS